MHDVFDLDAVLVRVFLWKDDAAARDCPFLLVNTWRCQSCWRVESMRDHLLLVQNLLLGVNVELVVADDILCGVLSQDGQHYSDSLPALFFRPR